jgi:hypothetical protein
MQSTPINTASSLKGIKPESVCFAESTGYRDSRHIEALFLFYRTSSVFLSASRGRFLMIVCAQTYSTANKSCCLQYELNMWKRFSKFSNSTEKSPLKGDSSQGPGNSDEEMKRLIQGHNFTEILAYF